MLVPRVAFFTDTYHQINGVALTSRMFVEYAKGHGLPFLCVRQGESTEVTQDGSVTHVQLKRGMFSITLDKGLLFDPGLFRHLGFLRRELANFRPLRGRQTQGAMTQGIEDLSEWVSDVETDGKGLPVLVKQYVRLGGADSGIQRGPGFRQHPGWLRDAGFTHRSD